MTLILPEQQHVWQKTLLPDDRIPVSLFAPKKNKNYQSTGQQKKNPKKKTLALTSRARHSLSVPDNIIRTGTKKSILRHQQRHERWFAFSAHNRPARTRANKGRTSMTSHGLIKDYLSYVKDYQLMGARDLSRRIHTPGFVGPPGTKPDLTARGALRGSAAL